MDNVITTEKIPIKIWGGIKDKKTMNQAKNLANLPFVFKHISLMSDSHPGYGMPIGGVMATTDVIIPHAVGVDIGCGVCAVKTNIKKHRLNESILKRIMGKIRDSTPLGSKHHNMKQSIEHMPNLTTKNYDLPFENQESIVRKEFENARTQVGTLGGGNHFIEIQVDSDDNIWIMLHSGSRNIGYRVARHHNKKAKSLNEDWYTKVPSKWQLAFLPVYSEEGQNYINEMKFCVAFAYANRKLMMNRILEIFDSVTDNFKHDEMINIAHNYAELENHFNKNVWVHRKGATKAYEDTIGLIPGSQGTNSYVVKGKGERLSFKSCSHGAGRTMGRREAKRKLDLKEEKQKLDDKGILHAIRGRGDLDESPGAYKNIKDVMKNQKDLVEIIMQLKPLAVIKG